MRSRGPRGLPRRKRKDVPEPFAKATEIPLPAAEDFPDDAGESPKKTPAAGDNTAVNEDLEPVGRSRHSGHTVAIVGRPNVGKSTLFNRIVGRRLAITNAAAGTTRDRLIYTIEHEEVRFDLIDTGGMGIIDEEALAEGVEQQIERAMYAATVLLFLVDARDGLTPADIEIAGKLRRLGLPLLAAANKVETEKLEVDALAEFSKLGLGELYTISALEGRGVEDMLDGLGEMMAANPARERGDAAGDSEDGLMRLTLVGRRNVGKSSFLNHLAGEDRAIVSDIEGTTRDMVDVRLEMDGRPYIIVDTAGIHRLKKLKSNADFFAQLRTEQAVSRADAVILLLDATLSPAQLERRASELIAAQYKPCVIAVNKWDLARKEIDTKEVMNFIGFSLPPLRDAPLVFTNAKRGINIEKAVRRAFELFDLSKKRMSTGELNRTMERLLEGREPPRGSRGRKPRLYYMTQVGISPPTVVVFCSYPDQIKLPYRRYLARKLRELMGTESVPVRVYLRDHRGAGTGS